MQNKETQCLKETDWKGCCCDCKYQHKVYKHPCNQNEFSKGSITELMGYICMLFDNGGIFFEQEHSFCEGYEKIK